MLRVGDLIFQRSIQLPLFRSLSIFFRDSSGSPPRVLLSLVLSDLERVGTPLERPHCFLSLRGFSFRFFRAFLQPKGPFFPESFPFEKLPPFSAMNASCRASFRDRQEEDQEEEVSREERTLAQKVACFTQRISAVESPSSWCIALLRTSKFLFDFSP